MAIFYVFNVYIGTMQKIIGFVFGLLISISVLGQEIEEPNGIYNFVPNAGNGQMEFYIRQMCQVVKFG